MCIMVSMMEKRCGLCVGYQMLIPIQMGQSSPKKAADANESSVTAANKPAAATSNKPKRTGSLALFFRKVSTLFDSIYQYCFRWTKYIIFTCLLIVVHCCCIALISEI